MYETVWCSNILSEKTKIISVKPLSNSVEPTIIKPLMNG